MSFVHIAEHVLFCNMKINSICVVRLSALGDVLMFVPLIRTLQHHFPQASITWIISKPAYDMVEGMNDVEFVVIDKPQNFSDYWQFKQKLKHRYFDILLATQASFRTNLLYACIRAKRKIGYDNLRANDGHRWFVHEQIEPGQDHTLEGFLKFARHLGVQNPNIQWNLPIHTQHITWARQHLPQTSGPIIIINPAASKPERSWLVSRYIEIINYLQTKWQATIILTGGPNTHDYELGTAITQACDVYNLIGKTQPKQLLALISLSHLVICPDTGPSHMAAAVNTPVIALHAVTGSNISGPYTFKHLSIDYHPTAMLLKYPNVTNTWGVLVHGNDIMSLIPTSAVIERLEQFFVRIKM